MRIEKVSQHGMLQGLMSEPKTISAKYFYDERGSALFEAITALPEYYQTRTEASILEASLPKLASYMDRPVTLIEYGSGSSAKTRILLEHLSNVNTYIPIDISEEFLAQTVQQLSLDFPAIRVTGVSADYTLPITLPPSQSEKRVVFFPGSTIGNFEPDEAKAFLANSRHMLHAGDLFLLGVDRKKDVSVVEAAYDDSAGVTAAFNKNVIARLNRETGAKLDESAFSHVAFYNKRKGRIEMHLKVRSDQDMQGLGAGIQFSEGELIHTENSYKFDESDIHELAVAAGFTVREILSDEKEYFSVCVLEVPGAE
ncbi:L-histidine N(alpha)-methyltransferase [Paenalkalicoccus suaedae]|uniref:L-histidine N(Alpha)-methyltransferase n=1 Tax=Paenalkalicoccus suaedae TaxID=2592382 RepID=A0A859FH76_9BACI|nr:L-histidine N(alpha)-methyltransferase [Paenalkalicoccus suaedae]QKS72469.1 L-histidine N(alpha)-methyltransferase [Paenalkalicoccus suaedae]